MKTSSSIFDIAHSDRRDGGKIPAGEQLFSRAGVLILARDFRSRFGAQTDLLKL